MAIVWTIFVKELFSSLKRPSYFVVLGIFSVYMMITYTVGLNQFQRASQNFQTQGGISLVESLLLPHISSFNIVLLILVPFLVVRMFSEEEKMHSFELLLSSPITSWEIVLGKYLASFVLAMIFVDIAFIYPISSFWFLDWNWLDLLSAYLGVAVLIAIYCAVSVFSSSLTSSTFLAGVMAIIMMVSLWVMAILRTGASSGVSEWVEYFWIGTHLSNYLQAKISLAGIFYPLSFVSLLLVVTQQMIESKRWR